jgi:hypothetical protein
VATERLRALGDDDALAVVWTDHGKARLVERDLLAGDVLHILRTGFVHEPAQPTTRVGLFKYVITGRSPNSGSRDVAVVLIPSPNAKEIKVITVMWVDETARHP